MPTPSSDQVSGLSSPQTSSVGISICPDELLASAVRDRARTTDPEQARGHEEQPEAWAQLPGTMESIEPIQPGIVDSSLSQDPDSMVNAGSGVSIGSSSRATTMSPIPQSAAQTEVSHTAQSVGDELNKQTREGSDASHNQNLKEHMPSGRALPRRAQEKLRVAMLQADHVPSALPDNDELYAPSMGSHFPAMRVLPKQTKTVSPSSFLHAGSRFTGTQQSERQVYEVQVEIKHVDMRESFLCGYLRIQGLTEDHPTLTTYFEGEIIGPKYNFFTKHESWGANPKTDLKHWKRFNAFHPYKKQVERGPASVSNFAERENMFMRWKEHFLVPDHRVRTITGASFEGFYYICFNQVKGEVSGIYFHSKSEKFQALDLKHVPDRGCFSAVEFR